ncbi:MAG: hypothetical protein A2046_15305 [Bacteroidetes bacterium GWA2_30_7]|nr:MAG: hypothetical protein A2046_15305 [Bacteroidetes bacterium GWA2_30_7]
MKVDAIINKRKAEVELISKKENKFKIRIDSNIYEFDIITTGNGSYSIIYNNNSWDIEAVKANGLNTFNIYKYGQSFKVEIEDALSIYKKNKDAAHGDGHNTIIAPMPGKIVKILKSQGDAVEVGETVIIISAMKMESEFKSAINGTIKKVLVKENDIVNGNQLLVEIDEGQETV